MDIKLLLQRRMHTDTAEMFSSPEEFTVPFSIIIKIQPEKQKQKDHY